MNVGRLEKAITEVGSDTEMVKACGGRVKREG